MTSAELSGTDSVGRVAHYRIFIDGEHVDSDEGYQLVNPADEELVATVAKGSVRHADRAVAAAKRVHETRVWSDVPPAERAAILEWAADRLEARSDELTALGSRENGSTVRLSGPFSVGQPVAFTRYFADLLRRYHFERPGPLIGPLPAAGPVRREPIGVCAGIVPWNFPLALAVWKAVPALAAGNPVVLKVDEKTPLGALEFAGELHEAGVPAGAINVITGDGPQVGGRLAARPDVRKIAFTGSTATGREVMRLAAGAVKRVTLELGGKGANIVLDDADLTMAVEGSVWAFLMHAGQACESGTRLLVPSSIHDEFVERLVARLATVRLGDPMDPATDMGPLISARQRDRVLEYISSGVRDGATAVCADGTPDGPAFKRGFWAEPTVFTDVRPDMRVCREEIFGPVLCVLRYDTDDDAVAMANDSEYGLSAGVWIRDVDRALAVARRLEAGSVSVNDWLKGHEYAKCQASKAGITFSELSNGFAATSDPVGLQAICDRLGPATINAFAQRWFAVLPLPLTEHDRDSGYWWELSMRQIEVSRTIVFHAPRHARAFFEALVADNLDIGRPERVEFIFAGRRARPGRKPASEVFKTKLVTRGVDVTQYESAGRRRDGAISREGSVTPRRALIELGIGLWQRDAGSRRYAHTPRERGKPGGVIACALARRVNKIAFAMVRDQTPFDPTRWS